MYDRARELLSGQILYHIGNETIAMFDALAICTLYFADKGVKKLSDFPVNEVYGHAIELARLIALKSRDNMQKDAKDAATTDF